MPEQHLLSGHVGTIGGVVALNAQRTPDRVALIASSGDRRLSYVELDRRSTRLAHGLLGLRASSGERITVWLGDCFEYVELYVAAAKGGLVVAPSNKRLSPDEVMFQIEHCESKILVTDAARYEMLRSVSPRIAAIATVLVGEHDLPGSERAHRFEDVVSQGRGSALPAVSPAQPFIVGYTSGTTGRPKGAVLTHQAVMDAAFSELVSKRIGIYSTLAYSLSLSFVSSVTALLFPHLVAGGTAVFCSDADPAETLDTIERHGANYVYTPSPHVGAYADLLAARPKALTTLRSVVHSGSKVPADTLCRLWESVGERLVEGWGMTETAGAGVTAYSWSDVSGSAVPPGLFESVGRPTVRCAVRVRPIAEQVDDARSGELELSCPSLMTGYLNDPDATAAALVDGWYRTGDIGYLDDEGLVHLTDRRTDLILSGGINVYPSEVESVISGLPEVDAVGVVGVPHPRWGETVVAVVVGRPGARLAADDVLDVCRRRLASYKKPARVVLSDALPYTASRKLDRRALRSEIEDRARRETWWDE